MKATVTTMSSIPWRFSRSTMCSIIGRLTSGSIGFGALEVSGRSRVPSPPAMITAFMRVLLGGSDARRRATTLPDLNLPPRSDRPSLSARTASGT